MQMQGVRLSRSDFYERLDKRSAERYGSGFAESWYETLRDDGLVFTFDRERNSGTTPIYYATYRHYRRALQIKRLHGLGITGRDAQLIQLFVRGYGVSPWEIREAFRREVIRGLTELRSKLRSGYFQNTKIVGPRHFTSLGKQLGPLDDRFAAIGLTQPLEYYLDLVRKASGVRIDNSEATFFGILNANSEEGSLPDFIEKALSAEPAVYEKAGLIFREVNRFVFKPLVGTGVINSPEFTACALGSMLVAENGGFSISKILDNLPKPAGFETQFLRVASAVVKKST